MVKWECFGNEWMWKLSVTVLFRNEGQISAIMQFLEFSVPQNPHFNRCHFSITQKLEKFCELMTNLSSKRIESILFILCQNLH